MGRGGHVRAVCGGGARAPGGPAHGRSWGSPGIRTAGEPDPGELGEALLRLGRVAEQLGALRAVWADQFESGAQWASDGARSGSAWVAARAVEHPASARARMHAGRDLRAVPRMAEAALRGEVRLGHVRLLIAAARAKPHRWSALAEVEELATRTAAEVSEPRFARFVERWAALVDAAHDAELRAQGLEVPVIDHHAAEQAERRELFLSRYGTDGMWALTGTLDTETGLALSIALESVCEAIRGEDDVTRPRPAPARRARGPAGRGAVRWSAGAQGSPSAPDGRDPGGRGECPLHRRRLRDTRR